jgi:hypothetical protein
MSSREYDGKRSRGRISKRVSPFTWENIPFTFISFNNHAWTKHAIRQVSYMSFADIFVNPMARACCFPSAMMA